MKYKIIRTFLALALFAAFVTVVRAPQAATTTQPSSADRVALYQALLDLQNPWTVMCVAAHPDDEDGTSLIVMRHKYGAHTVSLFSTFGEGGQNAIGPELYEKLGAIRAKETMAAAEIQGSEPHFLGLKDFGFSKTRAEAFKFWGHDEALRRMVLEIRKLRPDVIITNHSTTSNDHGQHQATALMVVEAFDAAADPTKFPEQLKDGVTTWQVQRLFVRARGNQQQADTLVTIDPNEKDPVREVVYGEEALRALQQHATQGPWPKSFAEYANRFRAFSGQTAAPTGQLPMIRYALVKSAKGAGAMPAQASHNFLDGLQLSAAVAQQLPLPDLTTPDDAVKDLSRTREAIVETYRKGNYASAQAGLADPQRRELMRGKMERAAMLVSGLQVDAQPPTTTVIANSSLNVPIKIVNRGSERINVTNCGSGSTNLADNRASDVRVNHARTTERPLSPGASFTFADEVQIPSDAMINVPLAKYLYEPTGLGLNLNLRCEYEIDQTKLGIDIPLRVNVAPLVEIVSVKPSPAAMSPTAADSQPQRIQMPFDVTLINHGSVAFSGQLAALEAVFGTPINEISLKLAAGEKRTVKFNVAGKIISLKNDSISFLVHEAKWSSPLTDVGVFSTGAKVAPQLNVGYVRGFDFSLPNALNALGVESKELSVDDVKTTDLSKFTSVIVDNRVYESKPELIAVNQKLLDYANAGGTLIVFYHKSDEWNPDERRNRPQLAPYKLILGGERVTDENAPITFLEPDHPLLNAPNKIGQDDFKDWIQERGLYYPKDWDPQFHALLQSNDPGEQPLKGGLLVADYGKGHYIYTSMVWYRELRGGIPGAYRMLANMISYGR